MFEDFSFCLNCEQYDRDKRWCKLLSRPMVCGCSYGEDKKPRNHFDWVKSLSEREFAEWLDAVSKAWYDEGYTKETDEPLMSPYPSTASKWLEWLKEEVHDS